MSRTKKILIVIAAVFVGLLLLARPSFHLTRDNFTTNAEGSSMTCGDASPSFCRRIAIVAPEDKASNVHLQDAVVRQLAKRLREGEKFVRSNFKSSKGLTSWQLDSPIVSTHATVKEAINHGADFVVIIKAPKWDYSAFPLSRTWEASVTWEGKPPALCIKNEIMGDVACVTMDGKLDIQGRTTGLFSTAYITNAAGDKAAESIARQLKEKVEDLVEKRQKKADKK